MNPASSLFTRLFGQIQPTPAKSLTGRFLVFSRTGSNLGEATYSVSSRHGGFNMGSIEFRNQWRDWSFTAHPEAVFNKESIAEIYAFLRGPRVENDKWKRARWRACVRDWVLKYL